MKNLIQEMTFLRETVLHDKRLSPNAKLLYSDIVLLIKENGECSERNSYFANLYNVTKTSISRWISSLAYYGYINIETIYKENSKEFVKRIITLKKDNI